MRLARFKTIGAAGALALVASLGLALVEETFLHTDDGCVVETHCLACRFALGSLVVSPARLTVEPRLAPAGDVAPRVVVGLSAPCARASLSRGPPAPPSSAS